MEKILIIIDAQNDFINGSLGSPEAKKVVPNIVKKIENHYGLIVCTQDTHYEYYLNTQEGRNLPVPHCMCGEHGWKIHDDIMEAIIENEKCLISTVFKNTFGEMQVAEVIEDIAKDNTTVIEIIGYVLDICVITNALLLKTAFPENKIIVDAACCAATSPEAYEAAITVLQSCQVEVIR